MKIICVGRNYSEHAKELGNAVPTEPVIFMKPQTAILQSGKQFYLPEWSNDIHYEAEIVLKINRNGKYIDEKFAHKYVSEYTVGIDFTARDVQKKLKEKGLPWEVAKAFDNSAVIGKWLELPHKLDTQPISFHMQKNGETVQAGNTENMIFSFSKIISYVSQYFSLRMGDLIYTGTPEGVGPVKQGDVLQGYVGEEETFVCQIK